MSDPLDLFNQLPANPEWVRKFNELSAAAAKDLECMVVQIAIKEDAKLGLSVDGIPESGPVHDLAQDIPRLLMTLAAVIQIQDDMRKQRPEH